MQGEPNIQREPYRGSSQHSAFVSLDRLGPLEHQLSQFMDPSFQCFERMMGTEIDSQPQHGQIVRPPRQRKTVSSSALWARGSMGTTLQESAGG